MAKLTALKVKKLTEKGSYEDGDGLRLVVRESGSKSWVLRYQVGGMRKDLGLGGYPAVGLKEAREMALEQKRLARSGVDPVMNRKEEARQAAKRAAGGRTFKECAIAFIDGRKHMWKNAKHAWQWSDTLERFAFPIIGDKDVDAVDTDQILQILQPIWKTKTETATRVRSRMENILDYAKARGYRAGENPARWRGHLATILPAVPKSERVVHHPAMPFRDMPAFIARVATQTALSARALEFTIHTAVRTNETLGALWTEIDMAEATWTIPATRTKLKRIHVVPLTAEALGVLARVRGLDANYIFPGIKPGKPLSGRTMKALLVRMGRGEATVHGFRSTFTDYLSEEHKVAREVREMALAHAIESNVEAAYRRGNLLSRRREAMQLWSDYLTGGNAESAESSANSDSP